MIKNKFLATLFLTSAISTTASYAAQQEFDFKTLTHGKLGTMLEVEYNAMVATVEKKAKQVEAWRPTMDAFNNADFDVADLTEENKELLDAATATGFVTADLTAGNKGILTAAATAGFVTADLTAGNKGILTAAATAGFGVADLTADNKAILDFAATVGMNITTVTADQISALTKFFSSGLPLLGSLVSVVEPVYLTGTEIAVDSANQYEIGGTKYDVANFKTAYGISYDAASGDYFDLSAKSKTGAGDVAFGDSKWTFNPQTGIVVNVSSSETYAANKNVDNGDGTFTVTDTSDDKHTFSLSDGEPFTKAQKETIALHKYLTDFGGKIQRFAEAAFENASADYPAALERLQAVALKFGK